MCVRWREPRRRGDVPSPERPRRLRRCHRQVTGLKTREVEALIANAELRREADRQAYVKRLALAKSTSWASVSPNRHSSRLVPPGDMTTAMDPSGWSAS